MLEECGVESVWTVEHVIVTEDFGALHAAANTGSPGRSSGHVPMPDPLDLLAFLSGHTDTVRLGTAVVVAPLHRPAVLAKRVATVDRLSNGRVLLGLGVGWQEAEYAAVGVPFADRGRRLDECIGAMRALWADAPATYEGKYVSFSGVSAIPQPAAGSVPIVLGGYSEPAVRRAGRLGQGWFPYAVAVDEFEERADLLRATASAAGRRAEDIVITGWPGSHDPQREQDVEHVRRFVDAGASRLVIRLKPGDPGDLGHLRDQIRQYQDTVLAQL